jgi:trimethylamine--corrinoid protein Co-methyltransferase
MLDLIDRVGPGGEFMSTKETAKRCRVEIWDPILLDRQPWVNWEAAGAQTMQDRIRARVRDILANHQPAPLPLGAAERIAAVLEAAGGRST